METNALKTAHASAFRLPLEVDLEGLRQDLAHCLGVDWRPHFNRKDYEGGWDAIALRSQDGQADNLLTHPDASFQDTWLLRECPHFQDVLQAIHCDKESVRLLRQAAGGEIKTHRDQGLGYADGVFRLHIPLLTHPDVAFVVAGERLPMQVGECWFADFSQPHSVYNHSDQDRIHLVIDCMRNAWTDDWLVGAGFDMERIKPPTMPEQQRQQMISELRRMNNPAASDLIAQLESESAAYHEQARIGCMLAFLDEIGIVWRYGDVPADSFLPGLEVSAGGIVIDRQQLRFPGDILHEAGHIALLPPEKRLLFTGNVKEVLPDHEGDELAVILWSFAASLHLGLPLDYVIHDGGYHGGADWLRDELTSGNFIGLPLLVWMGLCADPKQAAAHGKEGFPVMLRWMR